MNGTGGNGKPPILLPKTIHPAGTEGERPVAHALGPYQ